MSLLLLAQAAAKKTTSPEIAPVDPATIPAATPAIVPATAPPPVTAQPTIPQPAMSQPTAENPLDKLRDIHLPDQIDQFPYAPGWWILLALILLAVGFYLYRVYQYKRAIRLIIPAKAEIAALRALAPEDINAQSMTTLSALLKRVCLIYFPQKLVASLSGTSWVTFLNQQSNDDNGRIFFSQTNIDLFAKAAYQKNPEISQIEWLSLLISSDNCIETIIKSAAKKNKSSNYSTANIQSNIKMATQEGSAL